LNGVEKDNLSREEEILATELASIER